MAYIEIISQNFSDLRKTTKNYSRAGLRAEICTWELPKYKAEVPPFAKRKYKSHSVYLFVDLT